MYSWNNWDIWKFCDILCVVEGIIQIQYIQQTVDAIGFGGFNIDKSDDYRFLNEKKIPLAYT